MAKKQKQDMLVRMDNIAMDWLWRVDRPRTGPAAHGLFVLQSFYLAARNSFKHRLPFQANALTFISLLALVPALAISFALAKGLGFSDGMEQLLVDNEFLSSQKEVFQQIIGYVQRTKVGALGTVGLVVLILALIITISSVEETFNRIWDASAQRPWYRQFTDYLSVLVVCPLLIFAASGAWATFESNELVRWFTDVAVVGGMATHAPSFGPFALLMAAFVFIYVFLPNTKVPMTSALVGGVTAAGLWWGVQTLYIFFQIGVAKYNAIYGGFASLPLFMIWLQVSWTVVLFGAELAHAHYLCRLGPPPRSSSACLAPAQRDTVALQVMLKACLRFHRGQTPYSPRELAQELEVPQSELLIVVEELEKVGQLVRAGEDRGIQPGRSLDTISVSDVVEAVRGQAGINPIYEPGPGEEAVLQLMERTRSKDKEMLGKVTMLDLVRDPARS